MCVRSDTKSASWMPRPRRIVPTDRSDSSVERPASSTRMRSAGDAALKRVRAGHGRLRRAVAGQLAAGHDEIGRTAGEEQVHGVIEACREDARRPAVVLRGAEDNDRPGSAFLIATALLVDLVPRIAREQRDAGGRRKPDQQEIPDDVPSASRLRMVHGELGQRSLSGRGTSCTSRPSRTSTGRSGRCARPPACTPAAPADRRRTPSGRRAICAWRGRSAPDGRPRALVMPLATPAAAVPASEPLPVTVRDPTRAAIAAAAGPPSRAPPAVAEAFATAAPAEIGATIGIGNAGGGACG